MSELLNSIRGVLLCIRLVHWALPMWMYRQMI